MYILPKTSLFTKHLSSSIEPNAENSLVIFEFGEKFQSMFYNYYNLFLSEILMIIQNILLIYFVILFLLIVIVLELYTQHEYL